MTETKKSLFILFFRCLLDPQSSIILFIMIIDCSNYHNSNVHNVGHMDCFFDNKFPKIPEISGTIEGTLQYMYLILTVETGNTYFSPVVSKSSDFFTVNFIKILNWLSILRLYFSQGSIPTGRE